jgi:peptide/nickel transport system substrate-binding protein
MLEERDIERHDLVSAHGLLPCDRARPLYGRWFASGGTKGKEPPPRMRELMETFRQALGAPGEEQIRLAKEVWKIALDEVWTIGTVSQSPVITGVRVVKTSLGNVPARLSNGAAAHSPGNNLPQTYYWKQ